MPWFVKKSGDKYCVCKGDKDNPGPIVKCHPTKEEAVKHMRAIYTNYRKDK